MIANWQEDAVCTPDMAEAFTTDFRPPPREITRLGRICAACPVAAKCAALGLQSTGTGFYAGIFIPSVGNGRHDARLALARKLAGML